MPKPPSVYDFKSFYDVNPSQGEPSSRCIWYRKDEDKTCGNKPAPADVSSAISLKAEILCKASEKVIPLEDLRHFARLCSCKKNHRSALENTGLMELLVSRWQQELKEEIILQSPQHVSPAQSQVPAAVDVVPSAFNSNVIQTRSRTRQLSQENSDRVDSADLEPFSLEAWPRQTSTKTTASTKLRAGLGSRSSKPGSVYLFTRIDAPHLIKIGFSANRVERFRRIRSKCRFEPLLIHSFDNVPYAEKTEGLVHAELADAWRRQECCVCGTEHVEWYEIDRERAIKITGLWVEWMRKSDPYNQDWTLKSCWDDEIRRLEGQRVPITAKNLLASHSRTESSARSRLSAETSPVDSATSTVEIEETASLNPEEEFLAAEEEEDTVSSFADTTRPISQRQEAQQAELYRALGRAARICALVEREISAWKHAQESLVSLARSSQPQIRPVRRQLTSLSMVSVDAQMCHGIFWFIVGSHFVFALLGGILDLWR